MAAAAALFSRGARLRLRDAVRDDPDLLGRTATLWLPASTAIDVAAKSDGDAQIGAPIAAWPTAVASAPASTGPS